MQVFEAVTPFAPALPLIAVLCSIALAPALAPKLWHAPRLRGLWLLAMAAPALVHDVRFSRHRLLEAGQEYVAFVVLLGCLFVVASCTTLIGRWTATPLRNVLLLGAGTCMASLIGTTGASMLLIRPLLRSNAGRKYRQHTVVFFIFLVSNIGGLLLPLGDPPLFLGYLHGVPFFWTLRLWPSWLCNAGLLLLLFYGIDAALFAREPQQTPVAAAQAQVRWLGRRVVLAFAALLATMVFGDAIGLGFVGSQLAMLAIAAITYATTPAAILDNNDFSLAPLAEVAQVFAAIFAAMPAAIEVLGQHHAALPLHGPTSFFWATGIASSVLDNAPCYLSFATLAAHHLGTAGTNLAALATDPAGTVLLQAVAVGAVTMGAGTYVGNGPNLMVRSIAEHAGVKMPSFFTYMLWSATTLVPALACTQWLLYIAVRYTVPQGL